MKRGYLAIGAALVLAAVLGLWALTRSDSEPRAAPEAPRNPEPTTRASRASTATPSPRLEGNPGSGTVVKEYTVGDVRVRDHRTGDHPEIDVPPAIHAPEGRRIPSTLTSDIAQKLRAAVAGCGAEVPADAHGERPRVDGTIAIAIKDHQATITSATFQVRDVASAVGDPVKRCFEQKSLGVATASGDEADIEGYQISMQLRIP